MLTTAPAEEVSCLLRGWAGGGGFCALRTLNSVLKKGAPRRDPLPEFKQRSMKPGATPEFKVQYLGATVGERK